MSPQILLGTAILRLISIEISEAQHERDLLVRDDITITDTPYAFFRNRSFLKQI